MNKHIATSILLFILIISTFLSGCAKVVETKEETVQAEITDKSYQSTYTTYTYINKQLFPIVHPAVKHMTIKYNDLEETFSSYSLYDNYEIGDTIDVTLITKYMDDGTTKMYIRLKE